MQNKLLNNYIEKVKTHIFGLDNALTQLFNFYIYLLTGEDWVMDCKEFGYHQMMVTTTSGEFFRLELSQEGLSYFNIYGNRIFIKGEKRIFPDVDRIKEHLIKEVGDL